MLNILNHRFFIAFENIKMIQTKIVNKFNLKTKVSHQAHKYHY